VENVDEILRPLSQAPEVGQTIDISVFGALALDLMAHTLTTLYTMMLWGLYYKTFYVRILQDFRDKLECLSLASLSSLV
jgi:hypothetical protein